LTGGGPGTSTQVISFTIYQRFFVQDSAGYGAAMSVFVMFLVAVVIGVAMTRQKARSQ
jgi:multiple sugar transport system permease protein